MYETYISRVLKTIDPTKGITFSSKKQVCYILEVITNKLIQHTIIISKKQTITDSDVKSTLIWFGISIESGNCIIPSHIVDKKIRLGSTKHISPSSGLYITGVIEGILRLILIEAIYYSKKVRITVGDINEGVQANGELSKIFSTYGLNLLGVYPSYISSLPYTVKVRKITQDTKISKEALEILKVYLEIRLVEVLKKAYKVSQHSKNPKIQHRDLVFTLNNLI
jgi:histone H3/H4